MTQGHRKPDPPREPDRCRIRSTCPACGGTELHHIRGKLHCARCHVVLETCCD